MALLDIWEPSLIDRFKVGTAAGQPQSPAAEPTEEDRRRFGQVSESSGFGKEPEISVLGLRRVNGPMHRVLGDGGVQTVNTFGPDSDVALHLYVALLSESPFGTYVPKDALEEVTDVHSLTELGPEWSNILNGRPDRVRLLGAEPIRGDHALGTWLFVADAWLFSY